MQNVELDRMQEDRRPASPRFAATGNVPGAEPDTLAHPGGRPPVEVKETVIRLMTRLAIEHGAVNLSQGFTDEAPVYDMVWGGVSAMLGGTDEGVRRLDTMTLREILEVRGDAGSNSLDLTLKELLAGDAEPARISSTSTRSRSGSRSCGMRSRTTSRCSTVIGRTRRIGSRWCSERAKAWRVAFRSLLEPGDGVVVMQPYHELYPSQAAIFGLVPRFVTLREDRGAGTWRLDRDEVRAAVSDPSVKAFVVNTPHNPHRQGPERR